MLRELSALMAERKDDILESNTLDLEASREMAVPELLLDWLRLTPERVHAVVQLLQRLANAPDPLTQAAEERYLGHRAQSYGLRVPLGVVALIYESFPELGAIAAGLCLKSGNGLILKGGTEASQSNQMMVGIMQEALKRVEGDPYCVQLLPTDQADLTRELCTLTPHIQLLIPYGRPNLVHQITKQATVPTIKTAIGNCYLYCSPNASVDTVSHMIIDSHVGSPDAVNAIEKVMLHRDCSLDMLTQLLERLKAHHYCLKGNQSLIALFPEFLVAEPEEWSQPFLKKPTVLFQHVDSLETAIDWMNQYSSGHANCIATESYRESRQFIKGVTSATVYVNISPRFKRYSDGGDIALGIANKPRYRQGPIVANCLTSPKYIFQT